MLFVGVMALFVARRALGQVDDVVKVPAAPTSVDSKATDTKTADPKAAADNAMDWEEGAEAIPSKNLLEILKSGGILMIPIIFCSLLLVMFFIERLIALRTSRVIPRPFVKRFLQQLKDGTLDQEEALELCQENGSPVAVVFAAGVRKWGRPAVEVEQAILDAGERAVNQLRKYLRVFNGVSTVTPLLGLLGTVFGMISAFNAIAYSQAMGRPKLLASGISEALLTTAAGLSVAIPALIAYVYFISRVDRLIIEIDQLGQEVVEAISADRTTGPKGRASRPARQSSTVNS